MNSSTNNNTTTLYSIGHGNKEIEDFIQELKSFNIQYLVDIRSKPFSKWNPAVRMLVGAFPGKLDRPILSMF